MKVFVCLALCVAVAFAEPPSYRQQQQQRYFFARQEQEPASGPYPAQGWRPDGPAFNLPQRQQKQQQVESAYEPPQQPQQQYGPPQQPQQQYGPPQQPQQQYGAPQQPQQQYGAPQQPQQQYGAPETEPSPRKQNLPVFNKAQQFSRQQQQQSQQQSQQQYGAPAPQEQYGAPQSQYGAPEFTTTEVPNATDVDEPVTVTGLPDTEVIESEQVNSANEFEEELDESRQKSQQQHERGEYYVALPDGRLQRVRYVSRQDIEAMRYFAKIRAENVEPLRGPIYAYSPLQKLEVAPGNLQVAVAPAALTVTASEAKPQKLVAPKVDIKPLTQLQIQHDSPAAVVPLSSSYTTVTANYQVPEERYILAFP